MSVHALACVLGDGRRNGNPSRSASKGSARLVLLAIANYANDYGMCWPKIAESVAPAANVHRATVIRHLDELIVLGELRMFRRGHYQSPAFVMTIVDHPLTTQEIVEALVEIDGQADWRERLIDPTTGEASEVPVPGQGSLLSQRSSQIATISENDTIVSPTDKRQASDLGDQAETDRENSLSGSSKDIVADRDNISEIVADGDKIVATGAEIVALARRSSEPSENHQRTSTSTTTTITPGTNDLVADRDDLSGSGGDELPELEPVRWARRWCELTDKTFTPQVRRRYSEQVAEYLGAGGVINEAFIRRASEAGIIEPSGWGFLPASTTTLVLEDCDACDGQRLRGMLPSGELCDYDHPEADTLVPCPSCRRSEALT